MLRRILIAGGLVLALCALAAPTALAKNPKKVRGTTTWLCKPGIPDNPCEPGFDTTLVSPSGSDRSGRSRSSRTGSGASTASTSIRPSATTRGRTPISRSTRRSARSPSTRRPATASTAVSSRRCTASSRSRRSVERPPPTRRQIAYDDVLAAWKTYLRDYNRGRGVVLIGHSQGSFMLRELIHRVIDPSKKVRRRLVSAVLLGGNVTVASGRTVGGDFKHIAGCSKANQFGCVIAFSTFNAPVPPGTQFGRPNSFATPDLPDDRRRALHEPGGARRRVRSAHVESSRRSRSPRARPSAWRPCWWASRRRAAPRPPGSRLRRTRAPATPPTVRTCCRSPPWPAPPRSTRFRMRPGACTWSTRTSPSATSRTTSLTRPRRGGRPTASPRGSRSTEAEVRGASALVFRPCAGYAVSSASTGPRPRISRLSPR